MFGKSSKKILAALTLCELVSYGIRQNYEGRPRSKTVMELADELERRCDEAAIACGLKNNVEKRAIDKISERLRRFEKEYLKKEAIPMTVATSMALGALDEPLREVSNEKKRMALERVEVTLRKIHRHWDRRFDRWNDYEKASEILDKYDSAVCS